MTTLPPTRANHIELLVDGGATFDAIFAAIDLARDYLLVQFYIVRDAWLGKKFQDRLVKRARAAVKVYFLNDEVGCHSLSRKWLRVLRDGGVCVGGSRRRVDGAIAFSSTFATTASSSWPTGERPLPAESMWVMSIWAAAVVSARGATRTSGCAARRCRPRNWRSLRTGIGPRRALRHSCSV